MKLDARSVAVATLAYGLVIAGGAQAATPEGGRNALWMGGHKIALSAAATAPIPSFARQTKLGCNTCHTTFPQLTAFGRLFKLNGYTLTGIEQVTVAASATTPALALDVIPPVSAMVEASATRVKTAAPEQSNTSADLPQQFSLFLGEAITPKVGTFLQFTYTDVDGSFGLDNTDLRFADHATAFGAPLIYGLTLNNNPTVQDAWNTVPAWNFPYASSEVAPTPSAAPSLAGGFAQQVAGLGGYVFLNNLLYAELSGYHWAPQGGGHPADTTSTNSLDGLAPYWRVALSHQFGANSVEVGTLGMIANRRPAGIVGPTDRFSDVGLDAQFQRPLSNGSVALHGLFINENERLVASKAAGNATATDNHLRSLKLDGSIGFPVGLGATLAYFSTTGGADPLLFPSEAITGSGTGSPNSNGWIGELDYNAWQNVRLSAQYVMYSKFNGASSNYDAAGRNASDNNTLHLLAWFVF